MQLEQYPESRFRYVPRADVIAASRFVDIVEVVAETLRLHTEGLTILPEEAYLGWTTPNGSAARCLAMPGALMKDQRPVLGLKTINASLDNPARGIPRSQGFTLLLDPETARPLALMDAAYISAVRTAAVTAVAVKHLGIAEPRVLALIGCGTLARAHASLLLRNVSTLSRIVLYDIAPDRANDLVNYITELPESAGIDIAVADGPRRCVQDADLVVPVTTTTEGYIGPDWLKTGALIAHVSLDDLTEEAVLHADLIVVDDWGLVSADPRRLLGRMYRSGTLLDPEGNARPGAPKRSCARRVDASLGDVLTGRHPGRINATDIVVINPFGMAILDVAVADQVFAHAAAEDIGQLLTL